MGHNDMKQSNQSTNEGPVAYFLKTESQPADASDQSSTDKGLSLADDKPRSTSASMWSMEGLVSSRFFPRSNSTPPTHVDLTDARGRTSFGFRDNGNAFSLGGAVEENNQDDDIIELGRHDLVMPVGHHIKRSWSAPPVPDNFDAFFPKTESRMPVINESRRLWQDQSFDSQKATERTSATTVSPPLSPSTVHDRVHAPTPMFPQRGGLYQRRDHDNFNTRFMTLVDRVQEDFPRTPSPVFGFSAASVVPPSPHDDDTTVSMKNLRLDSGSRVMPTSDFPRTSDRGGDHHFVPSSFNVRASEYRPPQRVSDQTGYFPSPNVFAPPGFAAPAMRGVYAPPPAPCGQWAPGTAYPRPTQVSYPVAPVDYPQGNHFARGSVKMPHPMKLPRSGVYGHDDAPSRMHHGDYKRYDPGEQYFYTAPQAAMPSRPKPAFNRPPQYSIHPAHTYSATSLLEEFKSGAKAEKWDLKTIQGHIVQFARDQAGSRFIQQKLEKADDATRQDAFNEIFPQSLSLMADVFGNYVIQKLFDHGTPQQHRRLVNLMKAHMVSLALQVYGCRVIQKALEVTQVDEQLILIHELRGHVMECVTDQNGNHVLQKCIEAASWQAPGHGSSQRRVTGEDIQFIVDDFVGHATSLSMHAYGCRVIQRVLEHCSPQQIRPIVSEIIFKCRDLVKDQFGNYVVQHVICHGELDQRNTVMQAILPDIAKWSQHKYASNVVEACLEGATKDEIHQIVDLILDCDETGSSCALLPMMKHMYGNYVVQKLLDRADRHDRPRIVRIIQHNADYLKRFTYGKHVLSRLERESSNNSYQHQHQFR